MGLTPFFKFLDNFTPPPFESKSDEMFWLGANQHEARRSIVETNVGKVGFDISFMSWQDPTSRRVTIESHANYKYLLDIRGIGWSARLKYLLLMGSVVFVVDRPDAEYFWNEFKPWIHYVPVSKDGSDLDALFEKIKADHDASKKMAHDCRQRAKEVFAQERVFRDLAKIVGE